MGKNMITVGSIPRALAAAWFPFLAPSYRKRRRAIRDFTHTAPDFVFWIKPGGELFDAKDSHLRHVPPGFGHIVRDEPDYCGFLRGRLKANTDGQQLIVVYCRPDALATDHLKITQLLDGLSQLPLPVDLGALVISDNADIYGTLEDLEGREAALANLSTRADEDSQ